MKKRISLLLSVFLLLSLFGCTSTTDAASGNRTPYTTEAAAASTAAQLQDTPPTETTTPPTVPETTEATEIVEKTEATEATEVTEATEATEATDATEPSESAARDYVLNTNTRKFHYPSCKSAAKIKASNRKDYHGTREEIIQMGYEPCKNCNP